MAHGLTAAVTFSLSGTIEDQPIEIPAAPFELPLTGTYLETADERVLTISFEESLDESQVLNPPIELPDTPLPLPTILPPGSTANVILSLALSEIGTSVLQSGVFRASRDVEKEVPGDANGDGQVNVDDLLIVISGF